MWCDGFAKRDLRVGFVVKFNRDQALPRIAPLVTRHLKVTSLLLNEAHPSLRSSETRTPHRLNQPEEASPLCKHLLSAVPRLQAHRSFFQQPALNELQGGRRRGEREWGGGGGGFKRRPFVLIKTQFLWWKCLLCSSQAVLTDWSKLFLPFESSFGCTCQLCVKRSFKVISSFVRAHAVLHHAEHMLHHKWKGKSLRRTFYSMFCDAFNTLLFLIFLASRRF